jgi:hypothetical protein
VTFVERELVNAKKSGLMLRFNEFPIDGIEVLQTLQINLLDDMLMII